MSAVGQCQDEMFTFDLCIAPREHVPRLDTSERKRDELEDNHHHTGPPRIASDARVGGEQGLGSFRGGVLG